VTQARAKPIRWAGDWYAVVLFVGLWASTLFPLLSAAAANVRLVEAFSTDEAIQINLLARALREHSWAIHFGAYPHLYLNLALVPLKSLSFSTEQAIVVTARVLSLGAATGLLLFTFGWARRAYGTAAAWLALLVLALNPTVYAWATGVHPDMLQALCLLVALFWTVTAFERPRGGYILAASALAGLAFATKYSGLFVLPLIVAAVIRHSAATANPTSSLRSQTIRAATAVTAVVLLGSFAIDGPWLVSHLAADGHIDVPMPLSLDALVWIMRAAGVLLFVAAVTPWTWTRLRRWSALETVLWGVGTTLAAFTLAFALSSPYSFDRFAFLKGLYYEAMETGATMNVGWVENWTLGIFTTIGLPIAVAFGAMVVCWFAGRRRRTTMEIVLACWILLYIVVLLAPFHELAYHYALPIVAPAAMLAARGVTELLEIAAWRLPRLPRPAMAALAIAVVAAVEFPNVAVLRQVKTSFLLRERAPVVLAGQWLEGRVPTTSRVVYDYLSYVPPAFANVTATWGATREWLAATNPDVVVVNRHVSPEWRGPQNEEPYTVCLDSGACAYSRVFELDPITIFQKRVDAAAAGTGDSLGTLH
jgi:4-amino-4-deoxy-L-arabinose transferase-like glycosyltransferase